MIDIYRLMAEEFLELRAKTDKLRFDLAEAFYLDTIRGESKYALSKRSGLPLSTVRQMVSRVESEKNTIKKLVEKNAGMEPTGLAIELGRGYRVEYRPLWEQLIEAEQVHIVIVNASSPENILASTQEPFDHELFDTLFKGRKNWQNTLSIINSKTAIKE